MSTNLQTKPAEETFRDNAMLCKKSTIQKEIFTLWLFIGSTISQNVSDKVQF